MPEQTHPSELQGSIWRLPGLFPLVLVSMTGFGGFATLMSVVPLWVVRGGANQTGSGLVTTVLLISTVITQTFVPRLLSRFGHAAVLSAGLVALGLPSIAFGWSSALLPVLGLSLVRGFGFGILTVTGSAVIGELAPASRRGAAIGAYGLGIALPNLTFLPFSVLVAERIGFVPVFIAGAMPLLGLPAAIALGRVLRRGAPAEHTTESAPEASPADRRRAVIRLLFPAAVLLSVTLAGGALMTFLPQLTGDLVDAARSGILASAALLVLSATGALSRWWIGGLADRRGAARLMIPLLLLGAIGMGLAATSIGVAGGVPGPVLLLIGVALTGLAYGALQNLTLVSAFQQVDRTQYGTASAVWNIGFDSGTAVGSMVLGVIATGAGFTAGLAVLAVLMLMAVPLAWRLASR